MEHLERICVINVSQDELQVILGLIESKQFYGF